MEGKLMDKTQKISSFQGNMTQNPTIITKGQIDRIEFRNDRIYIFGWAAARNAGLMTDLRLSINHIIQTGFDKDLNYASPDVKNVHPDLDHTENCRFAIHFPADPGSISKYDNSLFEISPLFENGAGWGLYYLNNPELPIPQDSLISSIGGGFNNIGIEYLTYFTELGGLKSGDNVLDAGCGVGRMAYTLAYYLGPSGRYEGFDVMPDVIQWAQSEITPRYPNFIFQQIPVYNQHYNPGGTLLGKDIVFPYEDSRFDLAILTSVFTHMQGAELRRYLSELFRVIKPGGRCLCTCFLLNAESESLIEQGVSTEEIRYELADCYTSHPDNPEKAIGYKEEVLTNWIREIGFTLTGKYYGNWCKRKDSLSFQDILVLER